MLLELAFLTQWFSPLRYSPGGSAVWLLAESLPALFIQTSVDPDLTGWWRR